MLQIFKMSWDFYFFVARASVVFLIVPRGATPSLQNSTLFTFHQCQNTKSPSKLVSPQRNGSQTLFPRRFHCSALLLTFGGGKTSSFDVNGGHVRMQLTSAARCFVLSSAVILFDPHVKERRRLPANMRSPPPGSGAFEKNRRKMEAVLCCPCVALKNGAQNVWAFEHKQRGAPLIFDIWFVLCKAAGCCLQPSSSRLVPLVLRPVI